MSITGIRINIQNWEVGFSRELYIQNLGLESSKWIKIQNLVFRTRAIDLAPELGRQIQI